MAVNSNGNTWDTSRTTFTFTNPALSDILRESVITEKRIPFQVTDSVDSPQDYVYTIPFVDRRDAGTYRARVQELDCTCNLL